MSLWPDPLPEDKRPNVDTPLAMMLTLEWKETVGRDSQKIGLSRAELKNLTEAADVHLECDEAKGPRLTKVSETLNNGTHKEVEDSERVLGSLESFQDKEGIPRGRLEASLHHEE